LPDCNVEFLGVVFTKVKRTTNLHTQQMDALRVRNSKEKLHTFNTVIPETIKISEAAASNKPAVIINKYHDGPEAYRNLVWKIRLS